MTKKQILYETITILFYCVLITIMSFVPHFGFFRVGYFTLTILAIPVIVCGVFHGYFGGFVCAFLFGLYSYIISFYRSTVPFDMLFQNQIVAIIPRTTIGLTSVFLFQEFNKVIKKKWLSSAISTIISLAVSSFLIMLFSYLLQYDIVVSICGETDFLGFIYMCSGTNSLIELAITTFSVSALVFGLSYLYSYIHKKFNIDPSY